MTSYIRRTSLAAALGLASFTPAMAQDGVAAATEAIAAYSGLPSFTAPGPAFDARACMVGKKIFTIPASSAIPFIKTISDHKNELAARIGFEHMVWENQGNPTQWIQGIEHAVNNGFQVVSLLAGADPRFSNRRWPPRKPQG